MAHFIKTGFWEKQAKGLKGWLNLDQLIESIAGGGGGSFASLTGLPTDNAALAEDLGDKLNVVNTAVALTNAASMDLTASKHTLTTASATRTFTISFTGDDITLVITLNATASTLTFPATSLCVSEGDASGNNTLALSGVSGDKYVIGIKRIGSDFYVVSKNFGQ